MSIYIPCSQAQSYSWRIICFAKSCGGIVAYKQCLYLKYQKRLILFNAVFFIDSSSVSKQLSLCFQDLSLPLTCLMGMPGYQIKKRHGQSLPKNYCLAIIPLDDYHFLNLMFESSFKNTISYTIMFFYEKLWRNTRIITKT